MTYQISSAIGIYLFDRWCHFQFISISIRCSRLTCVVCACACVRCAVQHSTLDTVTSSTLYLFMKNKHCIDNGNNNIEKANEFMKFLKKKTSIATLTNRIYLSNHFQWKHKKATRHSSASHCLNCEQKKKKYRQEQTTSWLGGCYNYNYIIIHSLKYISISMGWCALRCVHNRYPTLRILNSRQHTNNWKISLCFGQKSSRQMPLIQRRKN